MLILLFWFLRKNPEKFDEDLEQFVVFFPPKLWESYVKNHRKFRISKSGIIEKRLIDRLWELGRYLPNDLYLERKFEIIIKRKIQHLKAQNENVRKHGRQTQ